MNGHNSLDQTLISTGDEKCEPVENVLEGSRELYPQRLARGLATVACFLCVCVCV